MPCILRRLWQVSPRRKPFAILSNYYTGFLGPIRPHGETDLFVNLRCMKISPEYISLYVGGGITLESDPAEEWNETQLKAQSLLKIMGAFIKLEE